MRRASGSGCTVPHRGHVTAAAAPGARQRYRQIHRRRQQRTVVSLASTSPAPSGPSVPQPGHQKPGGHLTVPACQLRNRRNPPRRPVERARDRAAPRPPHMVRLARGHPPVAGDVAHQPEHEPLPAPGPRHPPQTRRHLPAFQSRRSSPPGAARLPGARREHRTQAPAPWQGHRCPQPVPGSVTVPKIASRTVRLTLLWGPSDPTDTGRSAL